jgi:solute carrier family 35 protein E3
MATITDPKEEKLAMDVFAWFLNVSTSVLIVFVNKVLMDPKMGYHFVYGESFS